MFGREYIDCIVCHYFGDLTPITPHLLLFKIINVLLTFYKNMVYLSQEIEIKMH